MSRAFGDKIGAKVGKIIKNIFIYLKITKIN